MKKSVFFFLIFASSSAFSQITISPNNGYRGQVLATTVTTPGSYMTVSSGMGSMYEFKLKKGSYEFSQASYTYPYTGLGFAPYFNVTFNIPPNASPGFYDLVIDNYFWPYPSTITNAFQIHESHLQGQVFFDANQNGLRDASEYGIANQKILINNSAAVLYTDADGNYRSDFVLGSITDSLVVPSNFILTTQNSSYHLTIPPDTINNDFGIYTPPDTVFYHDFISVADPFRCMNHNSKAYWRVSSQSNNVQTGSLTIIMNNPLNCVASSVPPSSVSGDTLRWNYSLQPFQTLSGDITITGGTPSLICSFIAIDSLFNASGILVSVLSDTVHAPVRCSHDPNEKSVSPFGVDSMYHYTLNNEELTYTIRFQNCGTDTAYSVDVVDNLNSFLDLSTLRIVYASHNMSPQISPTGSIHFLFNNILLPDSNIDELNSHGMVIFKIRPLVSIPDHTYISNSASVYFDNNPAVITNNVYNLIVTQIPTTSVKTVSREEFAIYPVPVKGYFKLKLPPNKIFKINVYDVYGIRVLTSSVQNYSSINSESLIPGMYYYCLFDPLEMKEYKGSFTVIK